MSTELSRLPTLTNPILVAVWPGMGHVASSAGYYLLAKLGMQEFAELSTRALFDLDNVQVSGGIIRSTRLPQSRFFIWRDPKGRNDVVVFVGEAQPPIGKYAFCKQIIRHANQLGVQRVFTFAAMATPMHPSQDARVFGAATDAEGLAEMRRLELEILEDGQIGGLNGVLLGVAAEHGLRGICMLGEIPHLFAQLPFPKASLRVLEAFCTVAGIDLDLDELREQAGEVEQQLIELLTNLERQFRERSARSEPEGDFEPPTVEPPPARMTPADEARIESLFTEATEDRSKAYELKRLLDRLDLFADYEDRFLDLFR
ncbi:MAG: PAC2 family protein [Planctomycetota bacterium]|jgi:proteasome assembly chaperone (PAC2) family protein